MTIQDRILQLRNARGWSEYQLAEEAHIPQSTISAWYSKNRIPSVASLKKIAAAFHVPVTSLMADEAALVSLSPSQHEWLLNYDLLTEEQRDALLAFLKTVSLKN